jgi:hypothetical protein
MMIKSEKTAEIVIEYFRLLLSTGWQMNHTHTALLSLSSSSRHRSFKKKKINPESFQLISTPCSIGLKVLFISIWVWP